MQRIILLILYAGFFIAGCKKEAVKKNNTPVDTTSTVVGNLPPVPADSLRGVNWACDGDNFSDGILVLSTHTQSPYFISKALYRSYIGTTTYCPGIIYPAVHRVAKLGKYRPASIIAHIALQTAFPLRGCC